MLRKSEIDWVRSERKKYGQQKTSLVRQRDLRIRRKAFKAINDLAFLAQELSEDQTAQVFNVETLRPLLEAVLAAKSPEEVEGPVENERVFRIAVMLLRMGMSKGWDLIKSPFASMLLSGSLANLDYARTVLTIDSFLEHLK